MSTTRMLGILGTNVSPPATSGMQLSTNSTASSSVIQKRVIRSSVIVTTPVCACWLEDRDHAAAAADDVAVADRREARVRAGRVRASPATTIFSAHSFVAP